MHNVAHVISDYAISRQALIHPRPKSAAARSIHVLKNSEIFGESEPAQCLYKLVSGAAREFRILNDGRRQITGFVFPGDVFGFEADGMRLNSAEAINACEVEIMPLQNSDVSAAAHSASTIARTLRRAQDHLMLLVQNAEERVARFLLEMSERANGASLVELPMTRQDIADYLGLTIETVSRTFTHFEQIGCIELLSSRKVSIRKRAVLSNLHS